MIKQVIYIYIYFNIRSRHDHNDSVSIIVIINQHDHRLIIMIIRHHDHWSGIINISCILLYIGDAKEVYQSNGWLTYGEPLHRLREFGAIMKELDLIDESTLSSEQMRAICASL